MRPSTSVYAVALAAALGLLSSACGGKGSSILGPSAPTSVQSATVQGATIKGVLNPSVRAHSTGFVSSGANIHVTVVGTGLSTITDSSGSFVLTGVPSGSVTLHFEGAGIDAKLTLSGLVEGQTLTITVQVSGSNAVLEQNNEHDVEIKGKIESISGTDLKVAGKTVHTDSNTKIESGDHRITLADLKVGETVEVEGTLEQDGSILAKEIKAEAEDNDDQGENEQETDFKGKIESINPPNLKVSGKTVHTDAHTKIESGDHKITLTDLKVGETVEVEGTIESDGSILAKAIKVEEVEDDDLHF